MSNYNNIIGGKKNMDAGGILQLFDNSNKDTKSAPEELNIDNNEKIERVVRNVSTVENINSNIQELGIVTGIAVRSQNLLQNIVGIGRSLFADKKGRSKGQENIVVSLQDARNEALSNMNADATSRDPRARVIGTRVEVSELSRGRSSSVIIVTAYGTAVIGPSAKSSHLSRSSSIDVNAEKNSPTANLATANLAAGITEGALAESLLSAVGGKCGKKHSRRRLGRKPKRTSRKKKKKLTG